MAGNHAHSLVFPARRALHFCPAAVPFLYKVVDIRSAARHSSVFRCHTNVSVSPGKCCAGIQIGACGPLRQPFGDNRLRPVVDYGFEYRIEGKKALQSLERIRCLLPMSAV